MLQYIKPITISLAIFASSFLNSSYASAEDSLAEKVTNAGAVNVALASMPPYMVISPTGEATGATIELYNEVLAKMGLPALAPVVSAWNAMIPALQAGQVDFVANLTITAERCEAVIYSAPIYGYHIGLFVQPGNPKNLESISQLAESSEIKVAMLAGSANAAYAVSQGVADSQVVRVSDIPSGVAAVKSGRADVYIEGQYAVSDLSGLEVVVDRQSPVYGSAAIFRKEDIAFRDKFSETMIELYKEGAVERLYEKHGIADGPAMAELLSKYQSASALVPTCE